MRPKRETVDLSRTAIESKIRFGAHYGVSGNPGKSWDISNTIEELRFRPEINSGLFSRRQSRKTRMESSEPLVSVIIPVYNGEKYLAEAIESALAQIYRPIEIIVVDDGSTDRSANVVRGFIETVRYYYQPNSGSGAARNAGIQRSQGSFIAFLDADDLWVKEKLSLQMTILEADLALDMVFGHVSQFFSPDLDRLMRKKVACPDGKMPGYHVGTLLIRREAFLRVGLFNPALQCAEFLEWSFRAREKGLKELLLPDVLMKRRIHSSNMGIVKSNTRTDNSHADYVKVLKASLDRKRNRDSRPLISEAGDKAG